MKFLFRNNETHFEAFDFKKLTKVDRNNEAIRQATFTNEEYKRIYKALRTYCAKSNKKINELVSIKKPLLDYWQTTIDGENSFLGTGNFLAILLAFSYD